MTRIHRESMMVNDKLQAEFRVISIGMVHIPLVTLLSI